MLEKSNKPAFFAGLALLAALLPSIDRVGAQGAETKLFTEMKWRSIGPFRGGRTKAITGVRGQPNVFYMGAVNGGVWKTTDFGRTWTPIFDDQPTGSIGSIAVAPSDPNIVYVGSGEGLARPDLSVGDGIYKSTDAGRTWTHLGLRDGQQIPYILVDPRNPDRLFVAVLGHPYGPNEERGVYQSTDGGRTFQKVLSKDENTGASDLEFDPRDPNIVYACLWEQRQGPWENGAWAGTGGGIFKSTDGGATWRQLTDGLPSGEGDGVVQADVAVAPSDPNRIYATVANPRGVGIYRSDDAGEHWTRATTDARPARRIGGGDLPVPVVDPKNPDVVIIASTVSYRSRDGGRTWTALRGAPGGDDYQRPWIDPTTVHAVEAVVRRHPRRAESAAGNRAVPSAERQPFRRTVGQKAGVARATRRARRPTHSRLWRGRGSAPGGPETLSSIVATMNQLMNLLQDADLTPTTQLVAAVGERRAAMAKLLARWTALKAEVR